MPARYEIMNIDDSVLEEMSLKIKQVGTHSLGSIRIRNQGDSESANLRLTACLLNWKYINGWNNQGQEVISEKWLQARIGAGEWISIGGSPVIPGNYFDLIPPGPGDYIDVELRFIIPENASSGGLIGFIPMIDYDAS